METQRLEQQSKGYTSLELGDPTIDFYQKITHFTENLSVKQLQLLRNHVENLSSESPIHQPLDALILSKRETEVLILLTNGYNRRDIGSSLAISANTAARHIANIYRKLNISCVAEATHYAISHRIIS